MPIDMPMASAGVAEEALAPPFQLVMIPLRSLLMMASWEDSTTARK